MRYSVYIPSAFNATVHPRSTPKELAYELQRIDIDTYVGRVRRGKGVARCDNVTPSANTYFTCGLGVQRDCRRILFTQDEAGNVEAMGFTAAGLSGGGCAGPLPTWEDVELEDGDVRSYVPATDDPNSTGGTVIYSGITAGKVYEIEAVGTWGIDPAAQYQCGPEGNQYGRTCSNGIFDGVPDGQFWIKVGTGSWQFAGPWIQVQAPSSGNIVAGIADWSGLFGDNVGFMAVRVREL